MWRVVIVKTVSFARRNDVFEVLIVQTHLENSFGFCGKRRSSPDCFIIVQILGVDLSGWSKRLHGVRINKPNEHLVLNRIGVSFLVLFRCESVTFD